MTIVPCSKCEYAEGITSIGGNIYCNFTKVVIRNDGGCELGKPKPKTNADRIRAMTDEGLRDEWFYILNNVVNRYNSSYGGLLVWLKEEVKE